MGLLLRDSLYEETTTIYHRIVSVHNLKPRQSMCIHVFWHVQVFKCVPLPCSQRSGEVEGGNVPGPVERLISFEASEASLRSDMLMSMKYSLSLSVSYSCSYN